MVGDVVEKGHLIEKRTTSSEGTLISSDKVEKAVASRKGGLMGFGGTAGTCPKALPSLVVTGFQTTTSVCCSAMYCPGLPVFYFALAMRSLLLSDQRINLRFPCFMGFFFFSSNRFLYWDWAYKTTTFKYFRIKGISIRFRVYTNVGRLHSNLVKARRSIIENHLNHQSWWLRKLLQFFEDFHQLSTKTPKQVVYLQISYESHIAHMFGYNHLQSLSLQHPRSGVGIFHWQTQT